jgi:hypothetical protein
MAHIRQQAVGHHWPVTHCCCGNISTAIKGAQCKRSCLWVQQQLAIRQRLQQRLQGEQQLKRNLPRNS